MSCDILSVANSDHRALILEINNAKFVRGPGFWKFNNSYLKDNTFVEKMNVRLETLSREMNDIDDDTCSKWENYKTQIKQFCIEYGKVKSNQNINELLQLQGELQTLEEFCSRDPQNGDVLTKREHVKHKLELLSLDKARGAQIRSKINWIENGEKNTQFFLGLEQSRAKRKLITHIKREDGSIISNQTDVLNEQVHYFSEVYGNATHTCKNLYNDINACFKDEDFPRLNDDEASMCEGLITEEEAGLALRTMKNGISPGKDGLTIEFYKFFWNRIKEVVIKSFNDAYNKGAMSFSQKQGVLILLHKGKDLPKDSLNNWRPITLLNTDYKIMAKALANRLSSVLDKLIDEDQVGYLKGRNIASVIRNIDDVIEYMNATNKAGYLLALDYQKAFDTISKEFILESLNIFGFREQFRNWVKLIVTDTFSSINHGGWISSPFVLKSGIRQGCPFSSIAFILAVKIRNSQIDGIHLPSIDQNIKTLNINQLADDTTLFLNSKEDMKKAKTIIDHFSSLSGLKLNYLKTKAMRLGRQIIEPELPFNTTNKIKILGIFFTNDKSAANIEDNWKHRVDKIENIIKSWSQRDLGISGKLIVIKTFLLSQLIFIMQSIGLPENALVKINRILYKYLWQRKFSNKKAFEKIKRRVMESDISKGGLGMVNVRRIQESFRIKWAKTLLSDKSRKWTLIPKWHLEKLAPGLGCFQLNCRPHKVIGMDDIKSTFWKEVLFVYLKNKTLLNMADISSADIRKQTIWNNMLVKFKGNILFFPAWKSAGIENISDIIANNENRLMNAQEIMQKMENNHPQILFEYYALLNAIPDLWVTWIQSDRSHRIDTNCSLETEPDKTLLNTQGNTIKDVTRFLRNKDERENPIKPCAHAFWLRKLNFELNEETWLLAHKTTKETRLRELQWKILNNIYPTNILLHKMKIVENNKCSICKDEVDFLEHFFYDCLPVKQFWGETERFVKAKLQVTINLTLNDILFGVNNKTNICKSLAATLNHILLIGKMCISIYKKNKGNDTPFSLI